MNKKVIERLFSFFKTTFIHFYLDAKTNQKRQVCAYKSVNNGYSLNALNHSHIKCEQ